MQKPLVSVIVPIYNAQNNIVRCVESIRRQTYENLEILLLNDGSKDVSYPVCEMLSKADARIVLIDKENSGVSATRNLGMRMARGKYLQFVDADDCLEPDMFAVMLAALKREEADIQAAAIVHKAGEEADAQIEERRAAAQSELDGLSKRIADLQERESVITQRVSELRSMFSQAFSGFAFGGNAAASGQDQEAAAAAALPVVAPVPEVKPVHNEADDQPGELSGNESAADDHNETDAAPADSADSAAQNEQSESSEPSEHQTQGEPEAPTQENPAVSEQNGE